jgi:hypothetical protein
MSQPQYAQSHEQGLLIDGERVAWSPEVCGAV